MSNKDPNANRRNIAVPLPVYRRIKRHADRKGMKLREFPAFLLNAYESMTPEQRVELAVRMEQGSPATA